MFRTSMIALFAAPLALSACQHGGDAAGLRDAQIATCAARVADNGALPASDFSTVYDHETPTGNAVIKVMGPTGTFDCEIDSSYQIVDVIQTAQP